MTKEKALEIMSKGVEPVHLYGIPLDEFEGEELRTVALYVVNKYLKLRDRSFPDAWVYGMRHRAG